MKREECINDSHHAADVKRTDLAAAKAAKNALRESPNHGGNSREVKGRREDLKGKKGICSRSRYVGMKHPQTRSRLTFSYRRKVVEDQ